MRAITGNEQLEELSSNLQTFDTEAWLLPRSALVNLLNRFLKDEISADYVEKYADVVEFNEAVIYEPAGKKIIAECLFLLSAPEINGLLTHEYATTLIRRLVAF